MQDNLTAGLKSELERGRAVAVLGTGVTAACGVQGAASSWSALLESGLSYALELVHDAAAWRRYVEPDLEYARSGGQQGYVTAAQKIEEKLREHGEFRRWIRDTFKDLQVHDPSVVEAIANSGMPILTTNYDTLVEDHLGWQSVTWRTPTDVQAALSEAQGAVIHLHGCWKEPESIVFGNASYERLSRDSAAIALQEAIASLKSFVFIGMGAGVSDPNFSTLLRWVSTVYDEPDQRH